MKDWQLGVTDQCPKELVCLWEDLLRISCLIIMIISETSSYSPLPCLISCSLPPSPSLCSMRSPRYKYLCSTSAIQCSPSMLIFITSQGVRKVPKYSSRRSSFSSFFHPTGMASSQFAFSVQVFLIVIHSCSHVDKGLSIMAKTITSTVPWSGI